MNLETIYDWGLSVIKVFQQIQSPVLTAAVKGITYFGSPVFYIVFLIITFWCIDTHKGFRLGTVVIFSGALNAAVKANLQVPRPYQRDPSVFIIAETSFSTPSGHAQAAAAFWPVCMHLFRRKQRDILTRIGVLLVSAGIPVFIGCTRIYLGVHYPTDVMLGLIFGFLTSAPVLLFWDDAAALLSRTNRSVKLLIAASVCFALNMFSKQDTAMPGMLFGFITGYIFLCEQGGLDAKAGTLIQKAARMTAGIIISAGIFILLKAGFDFIGTGTSDSAYYVLCRFIRYGAAGFAISFISPAVFIKLKLASPLNRRQDGGSFTAQNNPENDIQ